MTNEKREGFVIQQPQARWGTPADTDLHIVLFQPEIPGNTGNIGRLCAGTDVWLHLVRPLGFELDNKRLRRAGLDYWPNVKLCVHDHFDEIEQIFGRERLWFFSKKTTRSYTDVAFEPGSVLVFGRETKGLGDDVLEQYDDRLLRIPMTDKVRSLNLSNACAVVLYEALRQLDWSPSDVNP
nr:tRNA (cytidine(34)-2'-O)-methyltransferase [Bradymonas sediminis]